VFGLFWFGLFSLTWWGGVVGDCANGPNDNCQTRRETMMHRWMLGEVLLLIGAGWIFYRLEMKDGQL
jgi:hypothetical protein